MEERINNEQLCQDYSDIERAIHFLEENYQRQPGLKEIAASVHLSEYHFQRLFTRWAGISPKRFLQFLTKEKAKQLLAQSANLMEATYAVGLSSPGRLHDLFITCEAVTPGEYKQRGAGLTILYGYQPSPFGECLIAVTKRGLCSLKFLAGGDRQQALLDLQREWPKAALQQDETKIEQLATQLFSQEATPGIPLYLSGSNFQIKVWEALLRIPPGSVVTYSQLAAQVGQPGAARAVGSAVARNPIAWLIPCHRVIHKLGDFGNYRYGPARKKAMLGWEWARAER